MAQHPPTLLLTRPLDASQRLVEDLRAIGVPDHDWVISPLIGIEGIGDPIGLEGITAVIFTSAYAVMTANWVGSIDGIRAYCVGDRTAAAARSKGFDSISAGGNSEDLISLILSHPPKCPVFHICGEDVVGDVSLRLEQAGVSCRQKIVYRQVNRSLTAEAKDRLNGFGRVIIPLYSPNTARGLVAQGPYSAPIETVAISHAVENALSKLPRTASVVSQFPNQTAMIKAISSTLGGN